MARLVMMAGGARSGKSARAEERLRRWRRVAYLATLAPGDPEMRERIARHRARRPAAWTTVEAPADLAAGLAAVPEKAEAVLVDCLTGFLSNRLLALGEETPEPAALERILAAADAAWRAARRLPVAEVVVVTNEVGAGVVPPHPLGRAFRDLAGWANQRLAAAADEVYHVRFGLAERLR